MTGDDLLSAIRRDPLDDAARLAYADWLTESGDPARGAAVAAGVFAHRLAVGDPARDRAEDESAALWAAHEAAWLPAEALGLPQVVVRRGFADTLVGTAGACLRAWPAVRERHPVRAMHWLAWDFSAPHYPDLPPPADLAGLESLTVEGALGPARLTAFLEWVAGLGLGELHLLDAISAPAITGSDDLSRLLRALSDRPPRALSVTGAGLRASAADALARSPVAPRLRSLDVSGNELGAAGASRLLTDPALAGLRHLNLEWNAVTDGGDAGPWRGEGRRDLRHLALVGNPLGPRSAASLASGPLAGSLVTLTAGDPTWNRARFDLLFRQAEWPALIDLCLRGHGPEQALAAFAEWPGLARLTALELRGFRLEGGVWGRIVEEISADRLRELWLDRSPLTAASLGRLLDSPAVANVSGLGLYLEERQTGEVRRLSDAAHVSRVRSLRLRAPNGPSRSAAVAGALARSPLFARLESLHLDLGIQSVEAVTGLLPEHPTLRELAIPAGAAMGRLARLAGLRRLCLRGDRGRDALSAAEAALEYAPPGVRLVGLDGSPRVGDGAALAERFGPGPHGPHPWWGRRERWPS